MISLHNVRASFQTCSWDVVAEVFKGKFLESWGLLSTIRKPIIAAVSGYAVSPDPFSLSYLVPFP